MTGAEHLEVEDELFVHVGCVHLSEGSDELFGVHKRPGEADDANAAVI